MSAAQQHTLSGLVRALAGQATLKRDDAHKRGGLGLAVVTVVVELVRGIVKALGSNIL
jgi:hypothetical protein